jgi:hypothetical protein
MDTVDREEDAVKPVPKRRPDEKKILCAHPVKGRIDHAALSREFMARFPKIRTALAK